MKVERSKVLDLLNARDKETFRLGVTLYFKSSTENRKDLNHVFKYNWMHWYKTYPTVGNLKKEGYELYTQ